MSRALLPAAVYAFVRRDGRVLLQRRSNTGYADGWWGVPAGKIDGGESAVAALMRELHEELGIVVEHNALEFAHVMHRRDDAGEWIDVFFDISVWRGEPQNCEPHKCSELAWFRPAELPADTIGYVAQALHATTRFSTPGWD